MVPETRQVATLALQASADTQTGMLQTHRDPTVNVWCRTAEEEVHDCVNKSLPYTPLLSYTAISNEADIPIPALNWEYFESFDRHDYIAWPDKPLNKIVWRGKLTQQYGDADGLWRMTGRVRLHELAHQTGIKRRVRSIDPQGRLNDAYIDSERLAARYLDASAIGSAYQCASQCDPQRDWFDSMGTSPKISGEVPSHLHAP